MNICKECEHVHVVYDGSKEDHYFCKENSYPEKVSHVTGEMGYEINNSFISLLSGLSYNYRLCQYVNRDGNCSMFIKKTSSKLYKALPWDPGLVIPIVMIIVGVLGLVWLMFLQ
jgi:hypothetical protein